MTSARLFLFDLDGTLVTTGGAGLRALERTFEKLYQLKNVTERVRPSGKTDPAIFREIVRTYLNRDMTAAEQKMIADTYLSYLSDEMTNSSTRALKGVMDFVGKLSARENVILALGTGNLEKGARIKLSPTRLNDYFSVGGFGSDAEDRTEVLKTGRSRAEMKWGAALDDDQVIVIGDTILDVAAAQRAGFRSVAVASGGSNLDTLRGSKPDYLWSDMTQGFEFMDALIDG